ncbi:unnamed protein product [Rhizophagus irregularis]|uniref:Uncharacterized protein n=1 Tax=Rhizophagus irregularis TaxID=588596 RepID=A0A915ZP48_9GLOM|nr:unnamed protein product [Rhizophagus irregularis]
MRLFFIFLLSILSIILLVILPVKSSITFEEPQPKILSRPRVLNTNYYDDGTIVVRIVRVNYTTPSQICVEENFTIRIIDPNGTIKGFNLSADELNIQPFNFCLFAKFNPIRFYPVKKNFLFLTYAVAKDVNNSFTYDDWGMIIDLNGEIKSKIRLGASYVNITTNQWLPAQDSVTLNVHRDNGFLRIAPITGTNSMILQQFKVNENGEIQSLAETYMNYTALPIDTVATMDGGYAVIYPDHTPPSTSIPFASYMSIRGFFLQNGESEKQGPFVLYQTQNQISNIILLDCDFTKVGFGQTCILVLNIAPAIDQNTFIKIDFLSTGTVYNITIFQNPADLADFSIQSLPYGGYLLYSTVNNQNDPTTLNLYGYILDDRSNRYDWNISYPTLTNFNGDILILPNNTLAIPQPEIDQIWGLFTTDLYKIEGAHDHGYGNLHILNTIPKIGENIDPSKITSLIIQFYSKVDLSSNRKITILQDGGIIRQTTSISNNNGDFVKFIDDYTIEIKVINSTFNQPNTKYYVLIDDGFVKSKDLQEPIPGIQDNAWNFMTIQQEANNGILDIYKNQVNASNIKGKIRLTAEGTTYFKSFRYDKTKVKEFFDNLKQELAKAIPVSKERIDTNEKYEIDNSVSPEQYILSINIKKAKNERSVNLLASDLNTLIRNKLITVIGTGEYTNYLDEEYGYETIPRWIEENLISLVLTILLNIVLLIIACWKKTFAIFICGNAIEKFVTTILFTSKDANSVENIFTASLFFVTFPFIVNLGFAFKVVIDELMRHDLRKLLEKVRKLKDDLKEDNNSTVKEGNNSTVEEGNNFTVKEDNISTIKEDNISIIEEDNGSTIEESNSSTAKEDNNSTVEDKSKKDNTNEVVDREEKVKELKKVLRDTRKELRKIKGELTEVSNLMKELKVVNELIEKLENPTSTNNVNLTPTNNVNPTPTNNVNPTPTNNVNPTPTNNVNPTPTNNVKDILKKLRGINDLIEKLMQVEDFTEDLIEVCINLNELDKLLNGINELKEVVVHEESRGVNMEESNEINREEPKEVTKFTDELNKIRKLMEGLNEIEKLKGQLNKAVDLMNRLKKKEPMSQNEHTTSENELTTSENKLIINELEKLERFKKELEILESFKRDSVEKLEDQNNMTNVNRNSVWEEVKRWSNIFSNKFISFQKKYEKKAMKVIEGDQPAEKKYRKISKWLRDYKDNQIIVIIFTILAGVDISHLELLGSNLRIKIPSFSFRGLEIRNIDVNFNAELSHAAKHSLFWGDVTNIFIEDISAIIIQIWDYVERPDATVLSRALSSISINNLYKAEIEEAEKHRILHLSSSKVDRQVNTHPQAIYTSRLLNPFTENLPKYIDDNSECLDCAILDE